MSAIYKGKVPPDNRFDYSPIVQTTTQGSSQRSPQRPHYRWPGGAGLAVYIGFNIEHFAFGEGMGSNIGPASPQPDVLNYS